MWGVIEARVISIASRGSTRGRAFWLTIARDDWHAEHFIRPVFVCCACAANSRLPPTPPLRLVSHYCLPLRFRALSIIQTMINCVLQGINIQLKILQTHFSSSPTSPSFIATPRKRTCFRSVLPLLFLDGWTGPLLRFMLHESRAAVMSFTAATTLR